MPIGNPPTLAELNARIAEIAAGINFRLRQAVELQTLTAGYNVAALEAKGFTTAEANTYLSLVAELALLSRVAHGTVAGVATPHNYLAFAFDAMGLGE